MFPFTTSKVVPQWASGAAAPTPGLSGTTGQTTGLAKYVDDILTSTEKMRRGVRLDRTQEAHNEDLRRSQEQITMEPIKAMAVDHLEGLNFTWDVPYLHPEAKMPVLDTTMWMGFPEREGGVPEGN